MSQTPNHYFLLLSSYLPFLCYFSQTLRTDQVLYDDVVLKKESRNHANNNTQLTSLFMMHITYSPTVVFLTT